MFLFDISWGFGERSQYTDEYTNSHIGQSKVVLEKKQEPTRKDHRYAERSNLEARKKLARFFATLSPWEETPQCPSTSSSQA